jgi:hypothetical protein
MPQMHCDRLTSNVKCQMSDVSRGKLLWEMHVHGADSLNVDEMQSTDRRHRLANPNTRAALAILCPSSPSSDSHQLVYNFRIFTSDDFPLYFISIIMSALFFLLARRFGGSSSGPIGFRGGDFRARSTSYSGVLSITR